MTDTTSIDCKFAQGNFSDPGMHGPIKISINKYFCTALHIIFFSLCIDLVRNKPCSPYYIQCLNNILTPMVFL